MDAEGQEKGGKGKASRLQIGGGVGAFRKFQRLRVGKGSTSGHGRPGEEKGRGKKKRGRARVNIRNSPFNVRKGT